MERCILKRHNERKPRCQAGDTLAGIAAALWGDANLWYKIAEVNGLTAESQLIEGMPLLIPVGIVRTSNTAETFKPYDPPEVLGSTSPTSPAPASGDTHSWRRRRQASAVIA